MTEPLSLDEIRRRKRRRALMDKRIDRAYRAKSAGIPINILDIPKVFQEGYRWIEANPGLDDLGLADALRAYVETIKQ